MEIGFEFSSSEMHSPPGHPIRSDVGKRHRRVYCGVREPIRRHEKRGQPLMSGAPPPTPVCRECGVQKTTRTEEITYNSTRKDSETKSNKGTADWASLSGERDHKDTQTTGTTRGKKSVKTTLICPTPGCPQRKRDRWELRRWKLDIDPTLTDTPETREWEIQRIVKDERQYVKEMDVLLSAQTPQRDHERRSETVPGNQDEKTYHHRNGHHDRQEPTNCNTKVAKSDGGESLSPSQPSDAGSSSTTEDDTSTDSPPWGYQRDTTANEKESTSQESGC